MGKLFVILGIALILVGALIHFQIFGKVPGDFSYKSDHFQIYVPIGTSILLSIVLSIILYFFGSR